MDKHYSVLSRTRLSPRGGDESGHQRFDLSPTHSTAIQSSGEDGLSPTKHASSRLASKLDPIPNLRKYDADVGKKKEWVSVYTVRDIPSMSKSQSCRCGACRALPRLSIPSANDRVVCKNQEFRVGDRVVLSGDRSGIIRWIGKLDSEYVTTEVFVGVQLDEPVGAHSGVFRGKRYFLCPEHHGVFVSKKELLYVKSRCELNYRPLMPISSPSRRPHHVPHATHPPSGHTPHRHDPAEPSAPLPQATPSQLDTHQRYMVERLHEAQRLGEEWLRDQQRLQEQEPEQPAEHATTVASSSSKQGVIEGSEDRDALARAEASVRRELKHAREQLLNSGQPV